MMMHRTCHSGTYIRIPVLLSYTRSHHYPYRMIDMLPLGHQLTEVSFLLLLAYMFFLNSAISGIILINILL